MKNTELVESVIAQLDLGNITDGVELVLNKRRTKPLEIAIVVLDLTQELIAKQNYRALRLFKEKLDFYITYKIK